MTLLSGQICWIQRNAAAPVQWNAVADSRFGTLVIRTGFNRIQPGEKLLLSSNFRIGHNPLGTRDVDGVFRSHQVVSSASRRWTLLGKTFNSTYGCVAIDWNESQQELAL